MDQIAIFSDKKLVSSSGSSPARNNDEEYNRRLKELKEKYGEV
jgi:hypothetical protein